MMRILHRRPSRGQSLVEFTLIVPILMFLMLGVLDFGRVGFYFVASSGIARTAARDAAVYGPTGTGLTDAQVISLVKQQSDAATMPNLTQKTGCSPIAPTSAPVGSCYQPPVGSAYIFIDRTSSTSVTVAIVYAFRPTTPMINALTGTIYTVSTATMNTEY